MRTVSIGGREYGMRYSLRGLFVFETIAGRPFDGKTLSDSYLLCYSTLLASNPEGFTLTFSDFIDACFSDPSIFWTFTEMMLEQKKLNDQLPEDKKKETASL